MPSPHQEPPARSLTIDGIPDHVDEKAAALLRSRMIDHVERFMTETGLDSVRIVMSTASTNSNDDDTDPSPEHSQDELSISKRALSYQSHEPYFTFDLLVLPDNVIANLLAAVSMLEVETKVFDEWNLRSIEPFPRMSLNFHGPSGTGKTLAAHALASRLDKRILATNYAQIESKYHGEGPKNVEAIFHAAERDGAVLFIDEADSLLSKRLANVTQGSEQAINSMRSQLLICLEKFRGIVIFATNFVESYDKAFRSRIRDIFFPQPDYSCRLRIWRAHLPPQLPLSPDVILEVLAQEDWLNGRDIKNVIIDAAVRAAIEDSTVNLQYLNEAIFRLKLSQKESQTTGNGALSDEESQEISERVKETLADQG